MDGISLKKIPDAYLPPVDGQDGNDRFRTGDSSAAVSSNTQERPEAADIINQEMAEKEQRRKVTPDC
ncbi:MAG: hypothetical protein IJ168_02905 [Eubacterium sp.]|nr:hypothetical protein [Eubacterium sp.]